jgi:hypothetical protein
LLSVRHLWFHLGYICLRQNQPVPFTPAYGLNAGNGSPM